MAGLIASLKAGFGFSPAPVSNVEPAPGIGGVTAGPGPANQTGFPGSTSQTRTFPSNGRVPNSPRTVKIRADYDTDANNYTGTTAEIRQSSYRGSMGRGGGQGNDPRTTSVVVLPQTAIRQELQHNSSAEFFGGPPLRTRPGDLTAGGHPLAPSQAAGGHSERDTTTPWIEAQPTVGGNTPGAQNVRNTYAQDYKAKPGELHTYKSAPRADQAPVNPGGQATDGNVHPERVVQDVTVPNRYEHDGVTSWSILREMPYAGRGNGARGADLNGQRYYATGQAQQFENAGQGEYGVARLLGDGNKRPVSFTQPAPWTANFYDTTSSVGTADNPNLTPAQQPNAVYMSAGGLRASNSTGRTG
jgi:hypothetical protein